MTRTYYTTESHAYPGRITCLTPATCTNPKHWSANENELRTLAQARDEARLDDAPATRIVKVHQVITTEAVETIDGHWPAEDLAATR
jgi:hypothetical protein